MQTLQIQLPDSVNIDTQEIKMLLASKLYEQGFIVPTLCVGMQPLTLQRLHG
ncbi:MAG: hypothetical protein Q8N30_16595 [Methylococcales bacterium]|nr:hypothetical protein [Methylococcales bacterium]